MPQSEYTWTFGKRTEDVEGGGESSLLQKQLGDMEGEVKEIQMELAAIKRDRLDQRNQKWVAEYDDSVKGLADNTNTELISKIREDEFGKFPEIAKLREELTKSKNAANEEKLMKYKYEMKLKYLESKLNSISTSAVLNERQVESRKISDEEVASLKVQLRDTKDELEEARLTANEKSEQLQEYRMKYLQAQQQVEELKRQLDLYEMDNKQVSDQIQVEIQKMKMQFQEKLQELSPLPDLLKGAHIQLQEAKQLQKLAEESAQQLANELNQVKEKMIMAVNSLNQEKADKCKLIEENKSMRFTIGEKQKEIEELCRHIEQSKCDVLRVNEKLCQQESMYEEKVMECAKLLKDLEELRAESSRTLSRSKERSESMRRYMQTQISELERQLVQSRAQSRACQKERDEIRQRMQLQISNLQENFELGEIRLRALQTQVTALKSSYSVILADEDDCRDYNKITT